MRITKLDGLRGVFCLMLIVYHYQELFLPSDVYNFFLVRESYTFVDFFFVLSGFVITHNYNIIKSSNDLFEYLYKRVARLYPLLFFSTCVVFFYRICSNYFKFLFPHLNFFDQTEVWNIYSLFNDFLECVLLVNSTPVFGNTTGLNGPSWSISSEMFSYIVFGFVSLYFISKKKSVFLFMIVVLSVLFLLAVGDLFSTGQYGFVRGLISFNLGYFVWLFSKINIKISNVFEYFVPIILLILLYQLNSYEVHSIDKQIFGILLPIFFGLAIFILLKTNGEISKFLDTKAIQFLGKISYSVYLNHAILVMVLPKILFRVFHIQKNMLTEVIVFFITTAIIIIYSNFTYKYVELKFGKLLKRNSFGQNLIK